MNDKIIQISCVQSHKDDYFSSVVWGLGQSGVLYRLNQDTHKWSPVVDSPRKNNI